MWTERLLLRGLALTDREDLFRIYGDPQVIGTCDLHSFNTDFSAGEPGCHLAREFWGKGLMLEALIRVIGFARDSFQLKRLKADIGPENFRSMKLFNKLGFRKNKNGILELKL